MPSGRHGGTLLLVTFVQHIPDKQPEESQRYSNSSKLPFSHTRTSLHNVAELRALLGASCHLIAHPPSSNVRCTSSVSKYTINIAQRKWKAKSHRHLAMFGGDFILLGTSSRWDLRKQSGRRGLREPHLQRHLLMIYSNRLETTARQ